MFRKGEIGIPGVKSMVDIVKVLHLFIKVIKFIFNDDELELGLIIEKMINYKTFFLIKPNHILYLHKLKDILNTNHLDLLLYKSTIQEKNNCLRIKFIYITSDNIKKNFLVEIYMSGKCNIKGKYPKEIMIERLNMIETYIFDPNYKIMIEKYTNRKDILNLLDKCSSDIIEHY